MMYCKGSDCQYRGTCARHIVRLRKSDMDNFMDHCNGTSLYIRAKNAVNEE